MKAFFIRWLVFMMVLPGLAHAKTPPTYMQTTLAKLIEGKAAKRGIPATDPRIGATLQGATSTIGGAAAAAAVISLAGVTAPGWVTAAVGVGLAYLFTAGIDLAIDGIKWLMNGDGSVKGPVSSAAPVPLSAGGAYWSAINFFQGVGSSPEAAVRAAMSDATSGWSLRCTTVAPYQVNCEVWDGQAKYADGSPFYQSVPSPGYSPSGSPCGSVSGACRNGVVFTPPAPADVTYPNISKAVESLTAEQLGKPVNPQVVAAIADEAWKKAAAQPGYQGVPYDAADPITQAEAEALRASNPTGWPTVGNLVQPQVTTADTAPWELPQSGSTAPPSNGGGTGETPSSPSIDWTIPSLGDQIPKQSVVSSFVPTVFAAPTGCPAPISFQMMGKTYTISYGPFCDLMATLAPLFLATGAAAAALIFAQSLKS